MRDDQEAVEPDRELLDRLTDAQLAAAARIAAAVARSWPEALSDWGLGDRERAIAILAEDEWQEILARHLPADDEAPDDDARETPGPADIDLSFAAGELEHEARDAIAAWRDHGGRSALTQILDTARNMRYLADNLASAGGAGARPFRDLRARLGESLFLCALENNRDEDTVEEIIALLERGTGLIRETAEDMRQAAGLPPAGDPQPEGGLPADGGREVRTGNGVVPGPLSAGEREWLQENLVTVREVASRTDVDPLTVSVWEQRFGDFPRPVFFLAPVSGHAPHAVYWWPDVDTFLKTHDVPRTFPLAVWDEDLSDYPPEDRVSIGTIRHQLVSGEARNTRRAAGLTQAEMARACGVTASAVGAWESGKSVPPPERARAYSRKLAAAGAAGSDGPVTGRVPGPAAAGFPPAVRPGQAEGKGAGRNGPAGVRSARRGGDTAGKHALQ